MSTNATVREWHVDEGWGVVDSDQTPGGCWVHFTHLAVAGHRALEPGQVVELEWKSPGQDGYAFRATRVWPAGTDPVTVELSPPSEAFTSRLTLTFDDGQPAIDCQGLADRLARDDSECVPESVQLRLGDHGH